MPDSVCTKLGMKASLKSAVIAPSASKFFASIGGNFGLMFLATSISPKRALRSSKEVARQKIAMTSLATLISKPVSYSYR